MSKLGDWLYREFVGQPPIWESPEAELARLAKEEE